MMTKHPEQSMITLYQLYHAIYYSYYIFEILDSPYFYM
jgi:hypothetical protein